MLLKSQTQMILNARALVLLHILVWSLPDTFSQSSGILSDISCLKSIRDSLEDPLNHIATSWTFNNLTEDSICWYVGVICRYTFENRVRGVQLAKMGLKGKFPSGLVDCSELISLDLSGNVISGSIPHDINEILPNLEVLELSNNNLSGEIPSSMGDCFTLKVVKLNNNRLSGQIPQQLSEKLEVLELSNNKLSGEIPSSMGNCSNLEVVKLNNNRLSGQIPQQLSELHRLIIFSVANNLLSGPVPDFIFVRTDTITPESYVNNSGLCGEPLDGCKHRWAFFELSFRSGFVVAFLVFASSYTAFFMYYFNLWGRSKKRNQIMPTKTPVLKECRKNKGKQTHQFIQLSTKALYKEESIQISLLEKMATKISFMKLSKATNNFSANNVITSGKTGTVYKARLPYGTFMAVKRLHASQHYENQFISELITLANLRHKNLVPLLGFCLEMQERLLVYRYMSNGSLHDWLHFVEDRAKMLEWPIRVKIIVGIARGLTWIHHMCHFQVVHLDISSKGILLHQNFEPMISTFGEAMFMNRNDIDLNKSCSINSEFREVELVKKDVYSLGIVLLELITSEEPSQMTNFLNFQESKFDLYDVIDKFLLGKGYDGEIFQFLRIACSCVQPCVDQRPTMLEVCKKLSAVREINCLTVKDDFKLVRQPEIAATITEDDVIITVHTN